MRCPGLAKRAYGVIADDLFACVVWRAHTSVDTRQPRAARSAGRATQLMAYSTHRACMCLMALESRTRAQSQPLGGVHDPSRVPHHPPLPVPQWICSRMRSMRPLVRGSSRPLVRGSLHPHGTTSHHSRHPRPRGSSTPRPPSPCMPSPKLHPRHPHPSPAGAAHRRPQQMAMYSLKSASCSALSRPNLASE
jgi:hypothetical protein